MAYLPTPEFLGDGADISEYVTGFRYSYGMNVFGNPNGRSRILPAGQLDLNNDTGYWTEARLSALDNVVGLADSHYMGDCGVKSYRVDHYNQLVYVFLQSRNAQAYDDPILFDTPTNYSEADVLTATGVTVTNLTDWGGWEVGAGFEYNGKLSKFLNDFGIWSDSYLIEGARGAFVAVVPSTENRSPTLTLHTPEYLAIARFAGNHYRNGWRRDAQEIQYIDSSLVEQRVTFPDGGVLSSYWSQGSGSLQSRGSGKYRAFFDLSAIFTLNQPTSDIAFIVRGALPGISDASGVKLSSSVGDGPWVTAINFNVSPGDDVQAVAFEGDWNIDIYYNPSETITNVTETVADDESVTFGLLPPMGFPIPATYAEQVGTKLSRYADNIPQVTRLVFPLRQPTQARFDALAGLEPGDVVDIDISDGILNIGTRNHVLFMSWNYQSRARPTLEIHFVSYAGLERRRVRYNTRGVDYNTDDVFYGGQPPVPTAPVWVASMGGGLFWEPGEAITAVTVPALNEGFPRPTYSASGLPSGITFDTNTRQLTGTPAAVGSGTITITATNSEGSDTYTYAYEIMVALSLTGEIVNTGFAVSGVLTNQWAASTSDLLDTSDEYDNEFDFIGSTFTIQAVRWWYVLPSNSVGFKFSPGVDDKNAELQNAWATYSVYIWWAGVVYEYLFSESTLIGSRQLFWLGSQYLAPLDVGAEGDPLGFIIAPSGQSPMRDDFGALP